ncbi:hypothetical protein ACR0ST_03485 [Aliidiomarina sp. Khilg15.8]
MSIQLLKTKNTLKLCLIATLPILAGGCSSMYEEHQRASAIQAQAVMERTMEEYRNAGTTGAGRWQMPGEQAVEYEERLKALAGSDVAGYLEPENVQAVACDLDETTRTWLVFQMSPERLKNTREVEAKIGTRTQTKPEVTLISGDCSSGQLEGEFVALYTYDYTFESEHMSSSTQMTGRSEGSMKNGLPDGEWRATNRDTSSFSFASQPRVIDQHHLGEYDDGQRVGSHVNLARTSSGDVLTVTQVLNERRELGLTWMAGEPNTRYFLLNGMMDGYLDFANAMLSNDPNCYRRGEQLTSNAYCESVKGELEALVRQAAAN